MIESLPTPQTTSYEGNVSTIVSAEMLFPVTCDHCDCDTDFSLGVLQQLSLISCGHCGNSRYFTAIEFDVLKVLLARAGFHFRG